MADQVVSISYEAIVTGLDRIQALTAQTAQLQATNAQLTQKVQAATTATTQQNDSFIKQTQHLRMLERAFAAYFLVVNVFNKLIKDMASQSEDLAYILEQGGDTWKQWMANLGNATAYAINFYNALAKVKSVGGALAIAGAQSGSQETRASRIQDANFEAEILRLKGDDINALRKKQEAENIKIIEEASVSRKAILKKELDEKHALEMQDLQLSMLGLQNQAKNYQKFQRDIVGSLQGGVSSTINNFLDGNKQSPADILKNFTSGINKSISDAIASALMTSLAGGGIKGFFDSFKNAITGKNSTTTAVQLAAKNQETQNNQMMNLLSAIRTCVCDTAASAAAIAAHGMGGPQSGTIEFPKPSVLSKIGAISGAIGTLAMLGAAGAGGGGGGGGAAAGGVGAGGSIEFAPGSLGPSTMHSGGFVGAFATGGEVPALVQPGEFVMRRSVSMANRQTLQEMNAGKRTSGGGGNVFMIKTNDAKSFSDSLTTPAAQAQLEIQIMKRIMNNGDLRRIIREFAK